MSILQGELQVSHVFQTHVTYNIIGSYSSVGFQLWVLDKFSKLVLIYVDRKGRQETCPTKMLVYFVITLKGINITFILDIPLCCISYKIF